MDHAVGAVWALWKGNNSLVVLFLLFLVGACACVYCCLCALLHLCALLLVCIVACVCTVPACFQVLGCKHRW